LSIDLMTDKEDLTAVIYIKSLSDFPKMYSFVSLFISPQKESEEKRENQKERRKRNRETE